MKIMKKDGSYEVLSTTKLNKSQMTACISWMAGNFDEACGIFGGPEIMRYHFDSYQKIAKDMEDGMIEYHEVSVVSSLSNIASMPVVIDMTLKLMGCDVKRKEDDKDFIDCEPPLIEGNEQ